MSLLAVGTVALDVIETPLKMMSDVQGGSATYLTLAARFFAEHVALVAVVGGDFPEEYVHVFRSRNIDLQGLTIDAGGKTFSWGGRYHQDYNQRDTLFTHLNVLSTFDPVVPDAHRDSRIVCLGNLDPQIQSRVLDQMHGPELVICNTMNYWIEQTASSLTRLIPRVDCLIVNESEARQLSGRRNLLGAAQSIRSMGPRILVITKGEYGAILFIDDTVFMAPAFPLEDIMDPTGAGDVFMGGFGGSLARERTLGHDALQRAVLHGSVMASFGVESFGPERLLRLSEDDITRRMDAFRRMMALPESLYTMDVVA